jgi:hypothetical protein
MCPDENGDKKSSLPQEVYQDGGKGLLSEFGREIAPAGKEIGRTLKDAIVLALKPIQISIWAFEKVEAFILSQLPEKLKGVPAENIVTPKALIAAPVIQYLRFIPDEPDLADLFLNLLASSMNKEKQKDVHPSFSEILKQISSDEAKMLKVLSNGEGFPKIKLNRESGPNQFSTVLRAFTTICYDSNCEIPENTQEYIDNLVRLGLVEVLNETYIIGDPRYVDFEKHPVVAEQVDLIKKEGRSPKVIRGLFHLTNFGRQFCKAVVR